MKPTPASDDPKATNALGEGTDTGPALLPHGFVIGGDLVVLLCPNNGKGQATDFLPAFLWPVDGIACDPAVTVVTAFLNHSTNRWRTHDSTTCRGIIQPVVVFTR